MIFLIPFLQRRLSSVSIPLVSAAFWTLAVMVHIPLQADVLNPTVLSIVFVSCLVLLAFVKPRWWKAIGTPGLLLIATIASYLVIGSAVSLVSGIDLLTRDVARQAFFLLVTLATILGGRSILERIGIEEISKWMLLVLIASCAVILLTPTLNSIGILPEYRLPSRLTGVFNDPNDAGFAACITAVLALALLYNNIHRSLAYSALALGCAAVIMTFSYGSLLVLGMVLIFCLILNGRSLRQDIFRTAVTVTLSAIVFVLLGMVVYSNIIPQQEQDTPPAIAKAPEPTNALEPADTPEPTSTSEPILNRVDTAINTVRQQNRGTDGRRTTLAARIDQWELGAEKVMESPFVGNGLRQLFRLEGAPLNYQYLPAGAHNLYLILIGEAGIISISLYLLFLFFLIRLFWTTPKSLARDSVIGWAIVMILFSGAFQHLLILGVSNFFIGLTCVIAAFLTDSLRKQPN